MDVSLLTQAVDSLPFLTAFTTCGATVAAVGIHKFASEAAGFRVVHQDPQNAAPKVDLSVGISALFDHTSRVICHKSELPEASVNISKSAAHTAEEHSDGNVLRVFGMTTFMAVPLFALQGLDSGSAMAVLGAIGLGGLIPTGAAMGWRSRPVQASLAALDHFLNRLFPDREHYEEIQAQRQAEYLARKHAKLHPAEQ